MDTDLAIALGVVVLLLVVGAVIYAQRRKSQQMRSRYGAEYIAAVDETGDRRKAEAELRQREKRVGALSIRPLDRNEVERFSDRWVKVQSQFVDDPGAAIRRADELLAEVMQARGYPVSDFEQRAADLSVDHASLVSNYRIAHEVADRHARGEADTEDLRRAMIHYRALFEDLLGPPQASRRPDEPRAFAREEPDDERTSRVRDEEIERGADDRAARERRPERARGDRGAPSV
jgi:hypothetical protein